VSLEFVILSDEPEDFLLEARSLFQPPESEDILMAVGGAVGTKAEEIMREYPEAPNRPLDLVYERKDAKGKTYYSKFKDFKSQRGFFQALKKGLIVIPYKRTGKLVQSLTHVSKVIGNAVKVTVGSNMPYASKVIGAKRTGGVSGWKDGMQTAYHEKTGWKSLPNEMSTQQQVLAATAVKKATAEIYKRLE